MSGRLEDQLFTMRFASKQMARASKKCEREEKTQLASVKKAIEKGNADMARIYATNAIRKKNEALNYMRMSARFDAVASQLRSAHMAGLVSGTMAQAVRGLERALQTENVEQISLMMGQFEAQVGMLDTQNAYMDDAMGATGRLTTPAHEVDSLIQQVADEHGLGVNMALHSEGTSVPAASPALAQRSAADQDEELTRRLHSLRDN